MLKIYLASRFKNQKVLRGIKNDIEDYGHEVTSRWLYEHAEDSDAARQHAITDIEDIDKADILILWPDNEVEKTSGKFVEFGYALGKGKPVFLVHPETTTCIFKLLPQVQHVEDWTAMLEILRQFAEPQYNYAL